MSKKICLILLMFILALNSFSFAGITEQQGEDLAAFAIKFVEEGNSRKDEKGFPLLTYGLTGSWNENVKIRNGGYNEQLYYVKTNSYYTSGGKYLELGNKWMMDCGTFVTYTLKKTVGLVVYNGSEPWHVQDIYNDALKGKNSKVFEFVYSGVAVGKIDYSKLKKGDVIARITPGGNHGMVYVGDGYIAHANRDMIRSYGNNKVSGFAVNKIYNYFLPGTVVRIMRIKDGIIPEDYVSNSILTWPDTGETVDLLERVDPSKLRPGVTSNDLVLEQREEEARLALEEEQRKLAEQQALEEQQRFEEGRREENTKFTIHNLKKSSEKYQLTVNPELYLAMNSKFEIPNYKLASK